MGRKIRILCIDGGGIKGVTALRILGDIMAENDSQSLLKPCDYFDLICGTSTGGLIALMLGRLEYTVDEAIKKYEELGKEIFKKHLPWLTRWDAKYDHNTLESCLKRVIRESPLKLSEEEPMKANSLHCRTFVVSTNLSKHSSSPYIMRSYDVHSTEPADAFPGKIWEAGRATSAAPTFFKPIVIEGQSYSDGATIANNPSYHGIMEAVKIWTPGDIDCILSLGTGPEGDHTMDNATLEVLGPWGMWLCKKMLSRFFFFRLQLAFYSLHGMTGTEQTHVKTKQMIQVYRKPLETSSKNNVGVSDEIYFRLNVTDSGAKVGLDAWQEMENLQRLASEYMRQNKAAIEAKVAIAAKLAHSRRERPSRPLRPETRRSYLDTAISLHLVGLKENKEVRALFDTGAYHNFVLSEILVNELGCLSSRVESVAPTEFITLGGQRIQARKRVWLDFRVAGQSEVMGDFFFVLENLNEAVVDVILGTEFISSRRFFLSKGDTRT